MLDALRRGARGTTAKILLGLLILSFAVWGVSSAFVQNQGEDVIVAGESAVNVNEYRLAYNRQLQALSQQFGTRLTAEQAEQLGIQQLVTQELVSGVVLDEQARVLDLGISTDQLAELIAQDPALVGFDGSFDSSQARQVLRNAGLTEEDYIDGRRRVAQRQQLLSSVASTAIAPLAFSEAMTAFDAQSRDIFYVTITTDNVPEPEAPDEAALAAWFEENVANYAAPEFRSVRIVHLTPEAVADPDAIADEDVREAYDRDLVRFTSPAQRDVQAIVFESREAADAAAARLESGEITFDALVAERGRALSDVTIGGVATGTYPDRTIVAEIDALAEGEVSPVLDGRFGPVIARAVNLSEEEVRPFEEVADEIRAELAADDAARALTDVSDAIEDARAGGSTLAEAVRELGLEVREIKAIDARGLDANETPVDLPAGADLVAAVFESEVGLDDRPLEDEDRGFVFYELISVEQARDRTLDEVRDRVLADYIAERREQAASELSATLETELREGTSLDDIAAANGLTVERAYDVRRGGKPGLAPEVVTAAFSGPEGQAALVPASAGTYRLVHVDRVVATAAAAEAAPVPVSVEEDVLQQFVGELQERYQPTFNAAVAERATSFGY